MRCRNYAGSRHLVSARGNPRSDLQNYDNAQAMSIRNRDVAALSLGVSGINCVHQAERFFVRQKRLLHLVHEVSEGEAVFRISESVTSARTRMSKRHRLRSKNATLGSRRIFHETGRERGRNLEDEIG